MRGNVLDHLPSNAFRPVAMAPGVHRLAHGHGVGVHATVHVAGAVRIEHMAFDGVSRGVAEVADANVKLRQA